MNGIKIFVSHRIDIDSELINNPIYVPVRCGAVFDNKNPMNILGDDTGDNISEKRMSFCEFTVQYWAWKNVEADYYGLCHYRRFLSFSEKKFKTDAFNMIYVPALMPGNKKKYGLLNEENMRDLISKCDIVTSEYAEVSQIPTPKGRVKTVKELWEAHDNLFVEKSTIDLMFKLIQKHAPEYSASAKEYFQGNRHRGFNCYVMKKELFQRLCEFQFPIMFEIERMVDMSGYDQTMKRTPGFVGEMLYGIFVYHVANYEMVKIKELQLVFFKDTEKVKKIVQRIRGYIYVQLDVILRKIMDPVFPIGSERREKMKDIYYKFTKKKRNGIAEIKEEG